MNESRVTTRCRYVIESPVKVRGKVWWTRQCKRSAVSGTDRCWQHQIPDADPGRYDREQRP